MAVLDGSGGEGGEGGGGTRGSAAGGSLAWSWELTATSFVTGDGNGINTRHVRGGFWSGSRRRQIDEGRTRRLRHAELGL